MNGAIVLIRFYVGLIFLCEGVLKFLRPEQLGPGRFDKAGIPAPTFFAYLDGIFEIACGLMLLAGLLTKLATVPMIINMIGALLITKLPILWGDAPLYSTASGGRSGGRPDPPAGRLGTAAGPGPRATQHRRVAAGRQ